ncbi:hypothetical protein SAMN04488523_11013 [Sulfitobacter brevis]|uniref:LPXTG-motif cell wall anchor domain-containing protein n=1 Tax=Sulfitobacter brevis TaxID=74348 RepID=A0A1I2D3K3_9RHOB|nr:hypothetical protein [Sulfitobacter brevis]SFE74560.1 hypothetical protein SAMN04488523_11013 [Sulfitobacter brevis]
MIRSQLFAFATFAAITAAPALAHVEPSAHAHTGEFNWLAASLATAGVVSVVLVRRRKAVSRP